ncbi:[SSU ribosomal protein S18P]-alanine acetyltransferase [Alkalithermobacter thermoalcaliphilus JW-YL-7 = DSM 7308]|uniref:[Ribosomal protein bS18]-alanine N-acetyltransferase n=1 Tax=Alkalithermobacter thermoalcaliphilus JW-YL-7 = DSM 7308 TaxID=1121328 RepID=A0A150FN73_CLOPD|nr:ribosomal-protein-alanine acetyltransferase [[Clostridium] paradoxum JW-YL-7 = DSM 7308]SHL06833.1 [SSU ribosomal protein S18P]-alanine acetyltransferase [[Clostridium] paradoxum JW-YL-7 = DSM 7308]
MDNVVVRDLKESDIDDLVEIEKLSFSVPWTKSAFIKELSNKLAKYVVIEHNKKVIAYGGIWLIVDEGHITNIAVHPDYLGKGLGNIIVESLIEKCRENKVLSMTLEVRKSNLVAQNLYKKYGFKPVGIRPEYYSDNKEDAVIMWKDL